MRPPRTPVVLIVVALALCAAKADPAIGADKQRVAKPDKETRYKPDSTSRGSVQTQGQGDDESNLSCFFDCLGSFFSGLSSSASPPPSQHAELVPWSTGQHGNLQAATTADSVWLWDGPGGADQDLAQVGRLPSGTSMIVLETYSMPTGTWLRVRPADQPEPTGWISASLLFP